MMRANVIDFINAIDDAVTAFAVRYILPVVKVCGAVLLVVAGLITIVVVACLPALSVPVLLFVLLIVAVTAEGNK